jgi:hypothetical protein
MGHISFWSVHVHVTTGTFQDYAQKDITSRLNVGNACCLAVESRVPFHLPSKKAMQ